MVTVSSKRDLTRTIIITGSSSVMFCQNCAKVGRDPLSLQPAACSGRFKRDTTGVSMKRGHFGQKVSLDACKVFFSRVDGNTTPLDLLGTQHG